MLPSDLSTSFGASHSLSLIQNKSAFSVRQKRELLEVFTGFEPKSKYEISTTDGETVAFAVEISKGFLGFLMRLSLKAARPFTIQAVTGTGELLFKAVRPWTWFFARMEVFNGAGALVGTIQRRFHLLRRYDVTAADGRFVGQLQGPLFKPWTFRLMRDEVEVGKITKKWSELLKEAFTDADNFGVELGASLNGDDRLILLGATFLIDAAHFENKG